jgi:hypothetical protein
MWAIYYPTLPTTVWDCRLKTTWNLAVFVSPPSFRPRSLTMADICVLHVYTGHLAPLPGGSRPDAWRRGQGLEFTQGIPICGFSLTLRICVCDVSQNTLSAQANLHISLYTTQDWGRPHGISRGRGQERRRRSGPHA